MHAITRGASTGIEEEGLALFVAVEDHVEFAVGKDDASAHEAMRSSAGHTLEAFEQFRRYSCCAKVSGEFLVVDGKQLAGGICSAGDLEGCDYLFDDGAGCLLSECCCGEGWRLARLICGSGGVVGRHGVVCDKYQ
jgi:hypothetical protein